MLTLTNFKSANAHTRRVTLNLMRRASSCPDDVAVVADKLAANGWDWNVLTTAEAEALFTFCTAEAAEAALAEFNVDTKTIHDLARDRETADGDYVDDDGDTHCPLCGHKHIRWGFVVRNPTSGEDFRCGSTCVEVYGLRVDGEAVAEAALKKLRAAITGLKRKATREDWQLEHPDHVAEMAIVAEALGLVSSGFRSRAYGLNRRLNAIARCSYWDRHWNPFRAAAKATIKYYDKHGFITATRTDDFYRLPGILGNARIVLDQMRQGLDGGFAKAWSEFFALHPVMNDYQRRHLQRACQSDSDPNDLKTWVKVLHAEVVEANAVIPLPPGKTPPSPGKPQRSTRYTADNLIDLPF